MEILKWGSIKASMKTQEGLGAAACVRVCLEGTDCPIDHTFCLQHLKINFIKHHVLGSTLA